jgi:hypothetical protein
MASLLHTTAALLATVAALTIAPPVAARAADAVPTAAQADFFEKRIRPLLVDACFRCHSAEADAVKGGLRLDSRAALLKGGETGPGLVAGHPEQSRLIEAITWDNPDLQMPPRRKLSSSQIADLTAWVRDGAPWPAESGTATADRAREAAARARNHWAFQPIATPTPPILPDSSGTLHPIDAFVQARLREAGLPVPPAANPRSLIRRVTYDLTGLPPTPEEVEAFAADPSPEAWERLVDRLLSSPHYGEKWGRHWLDLVRFAETNSYETDEPKPHAWRYRDYVIRALNEDKPYDRFIREQLAGDELPDGGADGIIATGYYRIGIWDADPADKELARYDQLDDIVATTGQVFLGLTVDCARCHDHKIDPIPQRDYYALLSFFHNVAPYRNGGASDEVPLPDASGKALAVTEPGATPPDTFVLQRGNPGNHGDRVQPAFPQILSPPSPKITPAASGRSSGRRLALADWIASRDNRLTARVLVNRVWQHHFGRGLARTPSDFGVQGLPPTHPELLDWLAQDFMARGWSLKQLHRRILMSRAYQASAVASPEALRKDPANDLFSRFDMRRLTAEEIRDSAIWVSGAGNPRMFGPGVYVSLPKEVLASQSVPGKGWGNSPAAEQARRSIYIHVKRSLLTPVLLGFDLAETDRSTPVRFATTQPTQALGTLNGTFFNERAVALAARVRRECGDSLEARVRRTLHLVTGRPPTPAETTRGVGLIQTLEREDGTTPDAAMNAFCLLALNLSEFFYLD